MYTYKDKMNIIASFNAKHKTCYQYDVKTDTVVEEFNRRSFPQAFDRWADTVLVKSVQMFVQKLCTNDSVIYYTINITSNKGHHNENTSLYSRFCNLCIFC